MLFIPEYLAKLSSPLEISQRFSSCEFGLNLLPGGRKADESDDDVDDEADDNDGDVFKLGLAPPVDAAAAAAAAAEMATGFNNGRNAVA